MTTVPAVRCASCAFAWNSAAMADGLRLLGSCPRCGGELLFRDAEPEPEAAATGRATAASGAGRDTEPHLVLGLPRR